MNRSNRISRWRLMGLFLSPCFLLSGCDQVEIKTVLSKLSTETTTTPEQVERVLAIHVDTSDQEKVVEVSEGLEFKKNLINKLYPEGKNASLSHFLETVSVELLEFLVSNQVEISTQSSLETYHSDYSREYGNVEGVYLPQENKIIFKEAPASTFESFLSEHFFHEIGHVVDTYLGDLAMTEGFQLIFEEGKERVFPGTEPLDDYYRENVWEYFAECFNLFFKNPEKLTRHEETYKYMCSVMEQIL